MGNDLFPTDPNYRYGEILPLRMAKAPMVNAGQPEMALPGFLRQPLNAFWSALTLPGAVVRGEEVPTMEDAAKFVEGVGLAGSSLSRPSNSFGVFGGVKAGLKTPEGQKSLQEAINLGTSWAGDDAVWEKTGWFKGIDGHWRFEIPDDRARLKLQNFDNLGDKYEVAEKIPLAQGYKMATLEDVLDHPELFAMYPQLKDIKVRSEIGSNHAGSYRHSSKTMTLLPQPETEMTSTMLHEVQHAIQSHEGFAKGGSPMTFMPKDFNKDKLKAQQKHLGAEQALKDKGVDVFGIEWRKVALENMEKNLTYVNGELEDNKFSRLYKREKAAFENKVMKEKQKSGEALFNDYVAKREEYKKYTEGEKRLYEMYMRLAGEVESRNVQKRFEEQDWLNLPSTTESRLRSKQIVKFNFDPVEFDPFAPLAFDAIPPNSNQP